MTRNRITFQQDKVNHVTTDGKEEFQKAIVSVGADARGAGTQIPDALTGSEFTGSGLAVGTQIQDALSK